MPSSKRDSFSRPTEEPPPFGEPLDEAADDQGRQQVGGNKEESAADGQGQEGTLGTDEAIELADEIHEVVRRMGFLAKGQK